MKRLELATLQKCRATNPAWRLLAADLAPFIVSFLNQAFVEGNTRRVAASALASALEDHIREARAAGLELSRDADAYLDEWADDSRGWLRKLYPPGGDDEAHFDLTPAAERAIGWVSRLLEQPFLGTESRLLNVVRLLNEMVDESETNADTRIAELQRRRDEIDAQIELLRQGHVEVMSPARLRERFQLMTSTAMELLTDFRQLDQRFHELDRDARRRISEWSGSRGELLEKILGEREAIASSDVGRSFRGFWDFLMTPDRQEEFSKKLHRLFELAPIADTNPDPKLRRIHFAWLTAGEETQRTVAKLSQQLRRYVDDRAFRENRRIAELILGIEQQAHLLRDRPPEGTVAWVDDVAPEVALPLERKLFTAPYIPQLEDQLLGAGSADAPLDGLFDQVGVNRALLRSNVDAILISRAQVSLGEVVEEHPLKHGLAELVGYFAVATDDARSVISKSEQQCVAWTDKGGTSRLARIPLVVFTRSSP